MNEEELDMMDLSFEVSYQDTFGKTYSKQLIENGKKIVLHIWLVTHF